MSVTLKQLSISHQLVFFLEKVSRAKNTHIISVNKNFQTFSHSEKSLFPYCIESPYISPLIGVLGRWGWRWRSALVDSKNDLMFSSWLCTSALVLTHEFFEPSGSKSQGLSTQLFQIWVMKPWMIEAVLNSRSAPEAKVHEINQVIGFTVLTSLLFVNKDIQITLLVQTVLWIT